MSFFSLKDSSSFLSMFFWVKPYVQGCASVGDKTRDIFLAEQSIRFKWIAGFQCHAIPEKIKIKIKTIQQIKSRIRGKKEGKYANTLAKIHVTAIFLMEATRRNVLPKFIEICMETPCCPYASRWASTWRKHLSLSLLPKRDFISRGTQKH